MEKFTGILDNLKKDPRYICIQDGTIRWIFQERGDAGPARMAAFLENFRTVSEDFYIFVPSEEIKRDLIYELDRLGLESFSDRVKSVKENMPRIGSVILLGNADYSHILKEVPIVYWYMRSLWLLSPTQTKESNMYTDLDKSQRLAQFESLDENLMDKYGIRQFDICEVVEELMNGNFPKEIIERSEDVSLKEKAELYSSMYEELTATGILNDQYYRDHYIYFSSYGIEPTEQKNFIISVENFCENERLASRERERQNRQLPFDTNKPLEIFLEKYEDENLRNEIRDAVDLLKESSEIKKLVNVRANYSYFYNRASEVLVKALIDEPKKYKTLLDTTNFIMFLNDLYNHREILED